MTKKCGKCETIKDVSDFSKNKRSKDGYNWSCKKCDKEYRENNKEQIKKSKQDWYQRNKEKVKKRTRQYYEENKDYINEKKAEYYRENSDKWIEYGKNRRSNMSKTDVFKKNLRTRIKRSVKRKSDSTRNILGCSISDFIEYVGYRESDNLELDHIVPCSLANGEDESIALNHYSNFQLLDSKENKRKGDRYMMVDNYIKVLSNHKNPSLITNIVDKSNINIKV